VSADQLDLLAIDEGVVLRPLLPPCGTTRHSLYMRCASCGTTCTVLDHLPARCPECSEPTLHTRTP
jgi:rubrerythrin